MAISANTLFHFTRFQSLKSILKEKAFYPRFSFEVFINQDEFIVAYPMVCFCDLPMSKIYNHAETYHRNGIGLNKEWGYRNGINPVFYLQNDSHPNNLIVSSFKSIFSKIKTDQKGNTGIVTTDVDLIKTVFDLTAFYKPKEGKIWNKENKDFVRYSGVSKQAKVINFYDEREWRYIPPNNRNFDQGIPMNFRLAKDFYQDNKFLSDLFKKANESVSQYKLTFLVEDIKYLIVSRVSDLQHLANHIKRLPNYGADEKNWLISRIISLRQIKEDF